MYAAESDWRDLLYEHATHDMDLALLHLQDHLSPPQLARVRLVSMQRVPAERRQTLAETEPYLVRGDTFRGSGWEVRYDVRLGLPITPALIMHEAAHVHLYGLKGEHLHDAEFRQVMLWLARPRYGARLATKLRHLYHAHDLTTGGGR